MRQARRAVYSPQKPTLYKNSPAAAVWGFCLAQRTRGSSLCKSLRHSAAERLGPCSGPETRPSAWACRSFTCSFSWIGSLSALPSTFCPTSIISPPRRKASNWKVFSHGFRRSFTLSSSAAMSGGRGEVTVFRSVLPGSANEISAQCSAWRAIPARLPPYSSSPAKGQPIWAKCTRSWWVRPVMGAARTSVYFPARRSAAYSVQLGFPPGQTRRRIMLPGTRAIGASIRPCSGLGSPSKLARYTLRALPASSAAAHAFLAQSTRPEVSLSMRFTGRNTPASPRACKSPM